MQNLPPALAQPAAAANYYIAYSFAALSACLPAYTENHMLLLDDPCLDPAANLLMPALMLENTLHPLLLLLLLLLRLMRLVHRFGSQG
jgi:hypothetical protein